MSTKYSSSDSSTVGKLVLYSPIDSEETLETKMAELKCTLIEENIYHCVSEANSTCRLASYSPSFQGLTPSYATRFAAWEKSMRELSDDANAAMGTLMALFDPDCNAHRELTAWFEEDVTVGTSTWLLDKFETVVKSQFKITVKSDVDLYLGIHFDYLPNGDVNITQPKRLQGLLEEYKDELVNNRARFPISPQHKESSRAILNEPIDPSDYLHLEGALIYLTTSRPVIQTTVSFGATHSVHPTLGDFEELIHCLKYLESTKVIGLILKAGEPNRDLILKCYVDASYLTHPDSKSHQGYCLSLGDIGSFFSKSSKQQLISTSPTQSEVRALQTLVADIIFAVKLCKELLRPISLPAITFEDNGAVIALSREMTF